MTSNFLPVTAESIAARATADPVPVCPTCHGILAWDLHGIVCSECASTFEFEAGFPNFVVGGRFEDEPNEALTTYEEECNLHTARHYFLPLFQQLFQSTKREPRILSLGCGTGADVDVLSAAGFSVTGIDCGSRCVAWPHREYPQRLLLANGKNLPFETASFDAVYCGCVFPHVGTVGDSHEVRPSYAEERAQLAAEMGRVLRPGGHVVVSSPNRRFPVDIFHGRSAEHPLPRLNAPGDPFLLSFADYQQLFRPAGVDRFNLLPVNGYWGFVRRKRTFKGRLSMMPVEAMFKFVSRSGAEPLRDSVLNPWLVVCGTKVPA
jgi:SAM-dependent methyltransferase